MDSLHISTRCFTAKETAGKLSINLKTKGGKANKISEAAKLWLDYHKSHSKENSVRAYKLVISKFCQAFGAESRNSSSSLRGSLTDSKIMLEYSKGTTVSEIARQLLTNRPKIERCIDKALHLGAITALDDLPGRKLSFNNASRGHAERVMDQLGIADRFETIFDIVDADYIPKPQQQPYDLLLRRDGIDPARAVYFEDMAKNLLPAKDMGMTTVWVHTDIEWAQNGRDDPRIDHETNDIVGFLRNLAAQP